jgi:hypothetical protein
MLLEEILRWTANIAIIYVDLVLTVWILVYGSRKWRKYPGGRAVMYFVVSLWSLINLAVVGSWFPDWQGVSKELLRDLVYLFIGFTSTRLLWVLLFRWQEVVETVAGSVSIEQATDREDGHPHREGAGDRL